MAQLALVDVVVLVDEAPALAAGRAAVERVLGRSPRLLQGLLLVGLVLSLGKNLGRCIMHKRGICEAGFGESGCKFAFSCPL